MHQVQQLLNQFLGQQNPPIASHGTQSDNSKGINLGSVLSGPGALATGAVAGGLAGLLLGGKKPKKIARTALQAGGVALVGGLAYKAWQNWKSNRPAQSSNEFQFETPPKGTPFLPETPQEEENLSKILIRAMIAAAKADGHVTYEERQRISSQLAALNLGPEETAFIEVELAKSLDIDEIADYATSPERAAEIYAASLLAIDVEGVAERGYLAMLAARLKLESGLVEHLHATTAVPAAANAA